MRPGLQPGAQAFEGTLPSGTDAGRTKTAGKATENIVCPSGKSVTASVAGCTLKVGSQTGLEQDCARTDLRPRW
jgi:hypothetical protein